MRRQASYLQSHVGAAEKPEIPDGRNSEPERCTRYPWYQIEFTSPAPHKPRGIGRQTRKGFCIPRARGAALGPDLAPIG
jgi:hypothetical protein